MAELFFVTRRDKSVAACAVFTSFGMGQNVHVVVRYYMSDLGILGQKAGITKEMASNGFEKMENSTYEGKFRLDQNESTPVNLLTGKMRFSIEKAKTAFA